MGRRQSHALAVRVSECVTEETNLAAGLRVPCGFQGHEMGWCWLCVGGSIEEIARVWFMAIVDAAAGNICQC